jgi:hypothetical protein
MKMSPGRSKLHLGEGVRFSKLTVRCQRHRGIDRECNVNVCVLGSDLMWFQHMGTEGIGSVGDRRNW